MMPDQHRFSRANRLVPLIAFSRPDSVRYPESMTTDLHEARTHSSKLLERATRGEDVVISRAGTPVAVLVGIDRYNPKRELGFATGAFTMASLEEFNAPLDPEIWTLFHGVSEA